MATLFVAVLLSACPRDTEPGRSSEDTVSAQTVAEEEATQGDAPLRAAAEEATGRPGDTAEAAGREPVIEGEALGASDSGVEGIVTVGPACPVVDSDRPCAPRPYSTMLVIREALSGDVVTEAESDSAGRFRVALPPGQYLLEPLGPTVVTEPTAAPVRFTVESGVYTQVALRFDTGVR